MTVSLTRRQADVLRFIEGYTQANGVAPTQRELAAGIGSNVGHLTHSRIEALEERGYLRRTAESSRNLRVTVRIAIPRAPDGAPLYVVPRFGEAG